MTGHRQSLQCEIAGHHRAFCKTDGGRDGKSPRFAIPIRGQKARRNRNRMPMNEQSSPQRFCFARGFFGYFLCPNKESNIFARVLSGVLPLLLAHCTLPTQSDFLVTNLRCSPSAFDSFRANTEIRYTLVAATTISIFIAQKNSNGTLNLVKTIATNIAETKGTHAHTWLGDTAAGLFAPSGLYYIILQIKDQRYETTVLVFHF